MVDNRTGLSAADIAKSFRDVCGDGSVEWVAGPMQTWLLLDAADMLDENDRLRELVVDMWRELDAATQYDAGGGRGVVYELADRMRELVVVVD